MLKRATMGAFLVLAALCSAQQQNDAAAEDDTIIETPVDPERGMELPLLETETAADGDAVQPSQTGATAGKGPSVPSAKQPDRGEGEGTSGPEPGYAPATAAPSSAALPASAGTSSAKSENPDARPVPAAQQQDSQGFSSQGAGEAGEPAASAAGEAAALAAGGAADSAVGKAPAAVNAPDLPIRDVTSVPSAQDWVNQGMKAGNRRPVAPLTTSAFVAQREDSHVVSQSRMFSVSGAEALRVGAIATHADELRGQVMGLLGMDNGWRHPISIRLYGQHSDAPVPRPIRLSVQVIGDKPVFRIRVHCGGGIQLQQLNKAIITMVLYEFSLRELNGDEMPDEVAIPEWLITGLYQAILNRSGKLDRRLYQNLFDRAEMLSPGDIIETAEPWKLDAASRQVYDVSCGVLIQTLINRPGGQDQLRELVRTSALADNTPKELIKQHFAELGIDQNKLTRWWALELAAFAAPRGNDFLTPLDSDKALSEALTMQYFDQKTGRVRPVELDNPYELARLDDWQRQSRPNVELLMELCRRCFPSYRPVITEYLRALHLLSNGGTPDEAQQIVGPQLELRTRFMSTAIRARDYLDWYEITTSGKLDAQSLDRYMDTVRELRQELPGPRTHLDRYLEDIETLYSLKANDDVPAQFKPAGATISPSENQSEKP